jgi:hypothetical protein
MTQKIRHVLGLSGGKDSSALAVFVRQHYPEIDVEYFFTDTGKELPEVYDYLNRLEAFLGKEIVRLNAERDFDFWLKEYGHFLPSPRTRWCTRQMKIRPFEKWIAPTLAEGGKVVSYVGIRADEPYREGYVPTEGNVEVKLPFAENGIDKAGVMRILEDAGLGLPAYYNWRSRSGCTFCFYQQKIEWVRLMKEHPEAFEEAKNYEKTAKEHDSPFTWVEGATLEEFENPEKIKAIEEDYAKRMEAKRQKRRKNPLLEGEDIEATDLDELYGDIEGRGACVMCHK